MTLPPAVLERLPRPLAKAVQLFSGQGARQGYLAAIDQAFISLSNFIATLLLARSASPTELGVYGVGFTALRLVRAVQEGLTIQPLNTYGAALPEDEFRRYASSTSLLQNGFALLSAGAVALAGWALTVTGNDVAGPTLFSLWPAFLWWQLQEYIRRAMYTRGHLMQAAVNTALANAVRLGLMIWWMRHGDLTGATSLNAIALGSLAALLPAIWQTRRYWGKNIENLEQVWKRNWAFGRWIIGGGLAGWVSVEFYPVLTAGMISFAAAGAYRAIQNIVAPIHLLLRALDTFLTPRLARAYQETGKPGVSRLLRRAYFVAGLPILSLLLIASAFPEALLELLYGETYLAYIPGLLLMALFYGLLYAYWPLQTALKAARQSRPIFLGNLAAILVMFSLGLWMIGQWGVYGTIGGQAFNALIVTLVFWLAWRKLG